MLVAGSFTEAVLAVHILAVVVSFGILFVYPLMPLIGARIEPAALPAWHRFQWQVHQRISATGLGVVVLAGIYLATDEHQWSKFYVGWGVAAAIVIGAIGGAYISPREQRLAELAEAAVGAGGGAPGGDYGAVARQVDTARLVQVAIAVLTVFFMALHVGS